MISAFLRELKTSTGVSLGNIFARERGIEVDIARGMLCAYLFEIQKMNFEDISCLINSSPSHAEVLFQYFDSAYYDNLEIRRKYDNIINCVNLFQ